MKPESTIKFLKESGHKVRVTHFRFTSNGLLSSREIEEAKKQAVPGTVPKHIVKPCGGKVVVEITTPDNKTVKGESHCSEKDNFKRLVGTTMALGRAMKQLKKAA